MALYFQSAVPAGQSRYYTAPGSQGFWTTPSNATTIIDYDFFGSSGSISGVSAFTFGNMTSAGTGVLAIFGVSAFTFGNMATTGSSALAIAGNANLTFGPMLLSSTGTLAISGSSTITFGAMSASSTGTTPNIASSAFTFGTMLSAGAGALLIQGSSAFTFGNMAAAATGTIPVTGTSSIQFGVMTVAADGESNNSGFADILYANMVTTGSSALAITGDASVLFGPMLQASTGALEIAGVSSLHLENMGLVSTGFPGNGVEGDAEFVFADMGVVSHGKLTGRGKGGPVTRERVFSALFALANGLTWLPDPEDTDEITWVSTSRRIKLFSDVPVPEQPWLGQAEHDEESAQKTGLPYKRVWKAQWIIYHSSGVDQSVDPTVMNNQILDCIELALAPKPSDPGFLDRRNTLSGLVYKCFIDGRVFKDPGDIDNQAMLVIPITLLVP